MFIINRSPRITTKKTIELYLSETVGGASNPTQATALFTVIVPIPELPLYVSRAALKIDIKCTNYLNLKKDGENSSIELGSGLYWDKEEWLNSSTSIISSW